MALFYRRKDKNTTKKPKQVIIKEITGSNCSVLQENKTTLVN